jgi:Fic family protein
MSFKPSFRLLPNIQRQIKAIERTAGFLEAVRLRPEWVREVRAQSKVEEALASLRIEGNTLTREEAFALSQELPERELRDSEREFCNYLRAFEAIEPLSGARDEILTTGDLLNLQRSLVSGCGAVIASWASFVART